MSRPTPRFAALRPPLYPFIHCDAGGMAIGDVTNDGKNEVAATWFTTVYRYYRLQILDDWDKSIYF